MVKKIEVDVEASLGFQANGMLKPADEKEKASKNIKRYECSNCNHKMEISGPTFFDKEVICPNCKEIMTIVY